MKLQSHSNVLQTNVKNETQNFGIGDASVVIEILRNRLYEHKIRTLCQEYICNARDAMREVGKGNTFEITVPNALNPVFKVRDFGPGISEDRMMNVFILYGSSTKRSDNTQTGGFGIGAKSAWAYTDSFAIITIVDGIKRSYVAHTGVNNNGRLDLISTEQTDEPNGTEIQVAVKKEDIQEFKESILRAIYFWKEKPILRGCLETLELPKSFRIGNVELVNSNDLPSFVDENRWDNNSLAVIDGVVYPINKKLSDKCKLFTKLSSFVKNRMIIHFETGSLEVSASRESIADSQTTIAALEKAAQKALLEIKTYIQEQFAKANSTVEFLNTYRDCYNNFYLHETPSSYGNYKVKDTQIQSDNFKNVKITRIHRLGRWGRTVEKITKQVMGDGSEGLPLGLLSKVYFLSGSENKIIQGRRIRSILSKEKEIFLIEPKTSVSLVETIAKDLNLKNFQEIEYTVESKEYTPRPTKSENEITVHILASLQNLYTNKVTVNLNSSYCKKLFYIPIEEKATCKSFLTPSLKSHVGEVLGAEICFLSKTSIEKVKGKPNYILLKKWVENFKPTDNDIKKFKDSVKLSENVFELLKNLNDLKDPILKELVKNYNEVKTTNNYISQFVSERVCQLKEVKDFQLRDIEIKDFIDNNYPLLPIIVPNFWQTRPKQDLDDVVLYLNSKYKLIK